MEGKIEGRLIVAWVVSDCLSEFRLGLVFANRQPEYDKGQC